MKTINPLTSACRHCRYYQPEGRRGGMCQRLGAPVQSTWEACALAIPAFATTWEDMEGIKILSNPAPVLVSSPLVSTLSMSQIELGESEVDRAPVQRKEEPLLV